MNKRFWLGKKVLITGGRGFLGNNLIPKIKKSGACICIPQKGDYDLRNQRDVEGLFKEFLPNIVIHLAVHGGGIGYMRKYPGSVFYDNIMMNTLVIEASKKYNVKKFVGIGTVCSYPKFASIPFREKYLWDGYPEETNAAYGLSKKMMLVQTQAYRNEYDFNGVNLILTNMYGPYDDFDTEASHVIPALIKKFISANQNNKNKVTVWGTGKPSRDFLYVEDAADAVILATEKLNKSEPINVGSGIEISIKELVELIARLVNFRKKIIWDTSKPDGQPRRTLDTAKAEREFGFKARTDIITGLKRTIQWYKKRGDTCLIK
jgi:GDP-L-fucose synthase